jgi:hypothetical protein
MLLVVVLLLASLSLSNETFSTGARHYGLRWHLRQLRAIFT